MLVKCRICGEKGEKSEMEYEVVGGKKKTRKYYHPGDCYKKHLKEKKFKERERKELDELYETIKKAHGVKDITDNKFWTKIQDIRNGNYSSRGRRLKSKDGYEYPLISYTYKTYWKEMMKAIRWKQKQGGCDSVLEQVHYGLGVIIKHLEDARVKIENTKTHNKNRESFKHNVIDIDLNDVEKAKSKTNNKHKTDISDFL